MSPRAKEQSVADVSFEIRVERDWVGNGGMQTQRMPKKKSSPADSGEANRTATERSGRTWHSFEYSYIQ
jgi:hypothetical protein